MIIIGGQQSLKFINGEQMEVESVACERVYFLESITLFHMGAFRPEALNSYFWSVGRHVRPGIMFFVCAVKK